MYCTELVLPPFKFATYPCGEMTQQIYQYSYLQILDFLTTVAFLLNGVQEGNPLVRFAINSFPNPLGGLAFIKILAVALGVFCWYSGKQRLLTRINFLFAALVAWNLVSLIINSAHGLRLG